MELMAVKKKSVTISTLPVKEISVFFASSDMVAIVIDHNTNDNSNSKLKSSFAGKVHSRLI